jgi:hypothetical protein
MGHELVDSELDNMIGGIHTSEIQNVGGCFIMDLHSENNNVLGSFLVNQQGLIAEELDS